MSAEEPTLIRGWDADNLFFGVHDDDSASPLTDHGFTATALRPGPFGELSGVTWRNHFQRYLYDEEYLTSDETRKAIAKHVLGGWAGYARAYTGASDWISTSSSLDWSIYEVARRLVRTRLDEVQLSLINRRNYGGRYRGHRAIHLDAADAVEALMRHQGGRREWVQAINFAAASSEVVFFGRIFDKDIAETTTWTLTVSTPDLFGLGAMS
jgi:hypothetical protein